MGEKAVQQLVAIAIEIEVAMAIEIEVAASPQQRNLLLPQGPLHPEKAVDEVQFIVVLGGEVPVVAVDKQTGGSMEEKTKYFVLKKKAVPEVLLKVVEAKKLLESGRAESVQEATDLVGISRSSFYKYKDDIFPFHDNAKGKTITMVIQMDDEPGLLSLVLQIVADYHANILTIHQSIPVNGIASLTLSVDVLPDTKNVSQMVENIEQQEGIHYLKILARE